MQKNDIYDPKGKNINFEAYTKVTVLSGHNDTVFEIDICKKRNLLVSGSYDGTLKLWNLENNSLLKIYRFSGMVYDVVFSNQGNLIAFGGDDCLVKIIDINEIKKEDGISEFKGHDKYIYRLKFSNDSKYLISGSADKTVRIWDIQKKKESFQLNSESSVKGLAISSDDTLIASNSIDGKIRIWNFGDQKLLCTRQAHTEGTRIIFSIYKNIMVSSGFDVSHYTINLWSLESSNQRKLLLIRKFNVVTKCIWKLMFSSCSRFIIFITNGNWKIKVIDSQTSEVVNILESKATDNEQYNLQIDSAVISVAMSKDIDIIAYGEHKKIAVWKQK